MHVRGTTLAAGTVAICLLSVGAGTGAGMWAGRHYAVAGPVGPAGALAPAGSVGNQGAPARLDLAAQAKITDMIDQELTGALLVGASGACPHGTTELPLTKLVSDPYLQWEVEGWVQDMLAKEGLMTGYSKRKITADYTLQYSVCRH